MVNIDFFADDDYGRMCQKQNFTCPLCQKKFKKFFIDYNRKTHEVRGLLCKVCIKGRKRMTPEYYIRLVNYLEQGA